MLHRPKQSFDRSFAIVLHIVPSKPTYNDLVVFLNQLSFHFKKYTFNILFGILDYIWDFPKGVEYMPLYLKIVYQVSTIFGLRFTFSKGLIKVMNKNKSWNITNSLKQDVKKLLTPITWYVRVNQTGQIVGKMLLIQL